MDRHWFLTWTTYGTWLPGDPRGFVSRVREATEQGRPRCEQDVPGTPFLVDIPGLVRSSRTSLKGEPIWLTAEQANAAAQDFHATAKFRAWALLSGSVMANHVHLVVGVAGDPDPARLLQMFKSYASRCLNQRWGRPRSGTWWTESGSRRKLSDNRAIDMAIRYVENQPNCLAKCRVFRVSGDQ